jgi:phosphotransferase system IIB component
MNKFIKKIFGIDKIEEATAEATRLRLEAEHAAKQAQENARVAKMTPKELATEKKEAYVAVLDTKVNKDNVRNGFFELDWNEYFVMQLREAGYIGGSEEEVVDQWFQDLCRNVGAENGIDMSRRGSGYVNFNNIGDGKTEVF